MTATNPSAAPWSLPRRLGFRMLFCYLALYFFPLPEGLSDPQWVSGLFHPLWQTITPWVGARLFNRSVVFAPTGSGDTTYDWVRVFCMAVIALTAAALWSLLDRRRRDYRTLHGWARIWLRYALAVAMIGYGLFKVFPLQFPAPTYTRLTETFGDASPMGLLWTFMGASKAYTMFAGAGELLGGVLLCFRRTTTLGALVVVGVMSNVVMMNFCYDVPVKLGSSHLLFAALVLLAPDARRLADFFLLDRAVAPADPGPVPANRWLRRAGWACKFLFLAWYVGFGAWQVRAYQRTLPPAGKLPPPQGYYAVERMALGGVELPPRLDDPARWKSFTLKGGKARIWTMTGGTTLYDLEGDPAAGPFTLKTANDGTAPVTEIRAAGRLTLGPAENGVARLEGEFEGKPLSVTLRLKDPTDFPLLKRGFHWINEQPYNR